MAVDRIIYNLGCGHSAPGITTLVSGELYCPWHSEMAPIRGVAIHEWKAICHTCRYARWAGLSKETAEIFATGHIRRNGPHRIEVRMMTNPEALRTQEKMVRYRALQAK